MVPPAGLEPARPAPEAGALSTELRGLARSPARMLSAADGCQQPGYFIDRPSSLQASSGRGSLSYGGRIHPVPPISRNPGTM